MKQLYFVRHGLSVMNETGFFSGRTETDLTEKGIDQAVKAGEKLKEYDINLIISSPLKRTIHTAEIIANEINYSLVDIKINELFIERDFGPLEGETYIPNLGDHPGVETMEHIIKRAAKALEYLNQLTDFDNILVVSHGAMGRALRHVINNDIPFSKSPMFNNGEIVKLI